MGILILLAYTILLFSWYLVAMWYLKRTHAIREEGFFIYYTVLIFVALGTITDVVYNIIFGTIIFMDIPRLWKNEYTLSQRLARIRFEGKGWRLKIADFVCEKLLNPRDPDGHHC